MNQEPFFEQFGNKIEAADKADLLNKLSVIDITVPSRSQGRRTDRRERYCIVKYMEFLANKNLLNYSLTIEKGESPDFILTLGDTKTVGIEHRDAGPTKFQAAMAALARAPKGARLETDTFHASNSTFKRAEIEAALIPFGEQSKSKGVAGDRWEIEWAELILQGIKDKTRLLNDQHFRAADRYELILYDNTHVGYVDESKAMALLQNYVTNDQKLHSYAKLYETVSVIYDTGIYYKVLHP